MILEIKSVEHLANIHRAQMITYLKLSGVPVGLIMNFNVPSMRQGIWRVPNRDLLKNAGLEGRSDFDDLPDLRVK